MKTRTVGSIIAISLLLGGCGNKTIQAGDTVSLIMTGTFENEELFETKDISIKIGSNEIIAGIETALIGMKQGEQKIINISPENGYGKDYKIANVQKISKGLFDRIQEPSSKSGEIDFGGLIGTVKGTESDGSGNNIVLFDLNPPQTWKPLIYTILIKDILPTSN